jgi:hypothetical protein
MRSLVIGGMKWHAVARSDTQWQEMACNGIIVASHFMKFGQVAQKLKCYGQQHGQNIFYLCTLMCDNIFK